jgi:hypothetical protein
MQDPEPQGPQRRNDHGPHEHRAVQPCLIREDVHGMVPKRLHLLRAPFWYVWYGVLVPHKRTKRNEDASSSRGEDCCCAHGRFVPLCETRPGVHSKSPPPTNSVGPFARMRHTLTTTHHTPPHIHGRCASLRTRGFICCFKRVLRQRVVRMVTQMRPPNARIQLSILGLVLSQAGCVRRA